MPHYAIVQNFDSPAQPGVTEISLRPGRLGGELDLVTRNTLQGRNFLITIRPDGSAIRHNHVSDRLGFQLDRLGRLQFRRTD